MGSRDVGGSDGSKESTHTQIESCFALHHNTNEGNGNSGRGSLEHCPVHTPIDSDNFQTSQQLGMVDLLRLVCPGITPCTFVGMQLLDDHLFDLWKKGLVEEKDVINRSNQPGELKSKIAMAKKGLLDEEDEELDFD